MIAACASCLTLSSTTRPINTHGSGSPVRARQTQSATGTSGARARLLTASECRRVTGRRPSKEVFVRLSSGYLEFVLTCKQGSGTKQLRKSALFQSSAFVAQLKLCIVLSALFCKSKSSFLQARIVSSLSFLSLGRRRRGHCSLTLQGFRETVGAVVADRSSLLAGAYSVDLA